MKFTLGNQKSSVLSSHGQTKPVSSVKSLDIWGNDTPLRSIIEAETMRSFQSLFIPQCFLWGEKKTLKTLMGNHPWLQAAIWAQDFLFRAPFPKKPSTNPGWQQQLRRWNSRTMRKNVANLRSTREPLKSGLLLMVQEPAPLDIYQALS